MMYALEKPRCLTISLSQSSPCHGTRPSPGFKIAAKFILLLQFLVFIGEKVLLTGSVRQNSLSLFSSVERVPQISIMSSADLNTSFYHDPDTSGQARYKGFGVALEA